MGENLSSFSNTLLTEKMSKTMGKILSVLDNAYLELEKDKSENSNNNFIQRISLMVEPASFKDELLSLIRGYIVNKHSANTSKPAPKFIYLSEDFRHLCWKSLHKNDEKMMEVN